MSDCHGKSGDKRPEKDECPGFDSEGSNKGRGEEMSGRGGGNCDRGGRGGCGGGGGGRGGRGGGGGRGGHDHGGD